MKIEVKPAIENAPKPSLKNRLWGDRQKKIRTIICIVVGIVIILLASTIYAKFFVKETASTPTKKTSFLAGCYYLNKS